MTCSRPLTGSEGKSSRLCLTPVEVCVNLTYRISGCYDTRNILTNYAPPDDNSDVLAIIVKPRWEGPATRRRALDVFYK